MTTHFNYSLQNFSMNNAKVLTGNSQPVPDFTVFVETKSVTKSRLHCTYIV